MNLRLYNTLSRTKEDFTPLDPQNVRLYVCGPTVYDFAHIGNARPVIVFDVLFRLLRHLYGEAHVNYVRNITDIDDKINARAAAEGVSIREVTEKTAQQYLDDVTALGCLPPTHTPRATEHIPEMIAMIGQLIDAGFAYPAEGHVLFDVGKKKDYGKLARRSLDEMIAGARVDVAPYKKNPMDFVLWKPSDAATPGWDSPWGRGRPGWHIECSAMSEALLGETFDIHGGGIDLVFPHHENEIAQSEGAHDGHPLARYWMHNGFLNVEGEKMSKSIGNFVTIHELLRGWEGQAWSGGALRLTMLKTHYRQPINWTFEELNKSKFELARFASAVRLATMTASDASPTQEFFEALSDDLNMPEVLRVIRAQSAAAFEGNRESADHLVASLEFLGLIKRNIVSAYTQEIRGHNVSIPEIFAVESTIQSLKAALINGDENFKQKLLDELLSQNLKAEIRDGEISLSYADGSSVDNTAILIQIEARNAARKGKNFKESDRIRDELLAQGIVLKDGPTGTTWEVKR